MNIATHAALVAMPSRLSAILHGLPDPDIDAEVAEAIRETGLYDDLTGTAKRTALYYYRVEMLAEELASMADNLKNEVDGTAEARRRVEAMSPEQRTAERQARMAAWEAKLKGATNATDTNRRDDICETTLAEFLAIAADVRARLRAPTAPRL